MSSPTLDKESNGQESEEQADKDSGRPSRSLSSSSSIRTRSSKRDASLKDQQSTGRKRAARLYPLDREQTCEWKGLTDCGGGPKPILGCFNGKQQARHHGPDKSVSNNEEGNVHRICHCCHYRWHAVNNALYDWNATTVNAHNPRPQTDEERAVAIQEEMKYLSSKAKKVRD